MEKKLSAAYDLASVTTHYTNTLPALGGFEAGPTAGLLVVCSMQAGQERIPLLIVVRMT